MDLYFALFAFLIAFSVVGAVIFSYREQKAKKSLDEKKRELSRKLFELSQVTTLSEEIGYSLDLTKIIEKINSTIEQTFSYSSVSYILINPDLLKMNIFTNAALGKAYVDMVRHQLTESAYMLDSNLKNLEIIEKVDGKIGYEDESQVLSYFIVPIVKGDQLMGIIHVGHNKPKIYNIRDMSILYNIVRFSMTTFERIQTIIQTEKGRLDSLLASISTGAIMFEIKEDILALSAINTAAKEFLGLSNNPDAYRVLTSFGPDAKLQDHIKKVLEEKKTSVMENVKIGDNYFKIYLNPVFLYGTGKIIGVSITIQNMTLEKQIQEIRETFTHMVVHELRAPLTSIKGASELLLSGKLNEEENGKMLELVKDSTVRMLSEISDLLDASKIEAGRFEISRQEDNLNTIVKERAQIFLHMTKQKMIDFQLHFDEHIPEFEFDPERIGQVMNNFLSNSIKYTHQGGKITITTRLDGNFAYVEVSDNGIGIPKEKQNTLFTKYGQVGQGGFKSGTTGLGLFISKSIIESHNGKIGFESEEEKGTKIFFTLPVVHSKQQSPSTSVPPPLINPASKILN